VRHFPAQRVDVLLALDDPDHPALVDGAQNLRELVERRALGRLPLPAPAPIGAALTEALGGQPDDLHGELAVLGHVVVRRNNLRPGRRWRGWRGVAVEEVGDREAERR